MQPSRRSLRIVFGALVAMGLGTAACSEESADPLGDLSRPSGLVYVERSDSRGDLFIADSEVDGVRVQQFLLVETETSTTLRDSFALAPSVFSSLIIPTPGFPTEMAFATATEAKTDGRLYVLAAAGVSKVDNESVGLVHVVDASNPDLETYPTRGSSDVFRPLGEIALERIEANEGVTRVEEDLLPVDLKVLSSTADLDRLMVVFDGLRDSQDGQVALLEVDYSRVLTNAQTLTDRVRITDSTHVPPGARTAAFTGTTAPALVVPSAQACDPSAEGRCIVTTLMLSDDLSRITSEAPVDVGGPSHAAIAAGPQVLVSRTDQPALVVLQRDGNGFFERTRGAFESPYTTASDRLTAELECESDTQSVDPATVRPPDICGRIDLASPVSAMVYRGSFPRSLPNPAISSLDIGAEGDDVLFLVHTNGFASFLVRDRLENPEDRFEVTTTSTGGIRTTAMTEFSEVEECRLTVMTESQDPVCNLDTAPEIDTCEIPPLRVDLLIGTTYRAEFNGSLYESRQGTLTRTRTSTTLFTLEETPFTFDSSLVERGDRVRVQLIFPSDCRPLGGPESVREFGIVEAVRETELDVRFTLEGGLKAVQCDESIPVGVFEVLPPENARVAVLKRMQGERVVEPEARKEYDFVSLDGPDGPWLARADFDEPLDITITSSRASDVGGSGPPSVLSCDVDRVRYCQDDEDCGSGRTCTENTDSGCRDECSLCAFDALACLTDEGFQRCDGIEMQIDLSRGVQINLRDQSAAPSETIVAVPSHAAFHPIFEGFVVSSPGARTLITLVPLGTSYALDVTR